MARRAETRELSEKQARPPSGKGGRTASRNAGSRTPIAARPAAKRARSTPAGRARDEAASAAGAGTGHEPDSGPQKEMAEEATGAILGANPFAGIDPAGVLGSAGRWLGSLGRQPGQTAGRAARTTLELGKIGVGGSESG